MITLSNISYCVNGVTILNEVNLQVNEGEFVFVVGETGAGKSTLLRMISMELRPTAGSVVVGEFNSETIRSRDIPRLRRKTGLIFSDARLLNDRDVFENVALPLYVSNERRREIKEKVLQALEDVGLADRSSSMPRELSVFEKQKVALARALVNNPSVLLADEPAGNLDPGSGLQLVELLQTVSARGVIVIVATHQYDLVRKVPGRIIQLQNGKVVEVELKE